MQHLANTIEDMKKLLVGQRDNVAIEIESGIAVRRPHHPRQDLEEGEPLSIFVLGPIQGTKPTDLLARAVKFLLPSRMCEQGNRVKQREFIA